MLQGHSQILIVDDDALTRKLFGKALSQNGYGCLTVGSADAAGRALRGQRFDLMLLDVEMPGKTGLELLPDVTRQYPDMVIVMVTCHNYLSTVVSAVQAGADDYIVKPLSWKRLIEVIEAALDRRSSMPDRRVRQSELGYFVAIGLSEQPQVD